MIKSANRFIGLAVSVLALAIALWGVKPARFMEVVSSANYVLMIPAGALVLLGLGARARSWHILLGGSVPYRRAFDALNEGYLLNSVLPLRLGEVGRAFLVSRGSTVDIGRAIATVVLERLIDAVVSLACLALSLPFVIGVPWARDIASGVAVILALALVGVLLLAQNRFKLRRLLSHLPRPGFMKTSGLADDFLSGLAIAQKPGVVIHAGLWSLVAWATTWFQLGLLMSAFRLQGSLVAYPFVAGVTAFGAALPSSPGAVGVFELSAVAALRALGHPHEAALSVAVGWHGLTLGITAVLGAWAISREGQTLLGLASSLQARLRKTSEAQPS